MWPNQDFAALDLMRDVMFSCVRSTADKKSFSVMVEMNEMSLRRMILQKFLKSQWAELCSACWQLSIWAVIGFIRKKEII